MSSNSPPPRAHKSRTSDAVADSPQRLPQLTSGASSSATTSPQKPPSSTGTGGLGPPTYRPTTLPQRVQEPQQLPTQLPLPTPSSPEQTLQSPAAASGGGGSSGRRALGVTSDAATAAPSSGILPAWVRLDLSVLTRPSPAAAATNPHPTSTTYGYPAPASTTASAVPSREVLYRAQLKQGAVGGVFPAEPLLSPPPTMYKEGFEVGTRVDGRPAAPRSLFHPSEPRYRQCVSTLVPPPPLMRVGSAGTLHSSVLGLRPLIEWVPVPGWDDTEMCRDGKGGYFKADAKTGKTYRVSWAQQRDLSRPPTESASGAATPVSPSPLLGGGLPISLLEPESTPGMCYMRNTDVQEQQQLIQQEEHRAARQQSSTAGAAQTYRNLQFMTPSPDTDLLKQERNIGVSASATATVGISPVVILPTMAADGEVDLHGEEHKGEGEGGEAASSSQEAEQDREKRMRRETRAESASAHVDQLTTEPVMHTMGVVNSSAARPVSAPLPSDTKAPQRTTPNELPERVLTTNPSVFITAAAAAAEAVADADNAGHFPCYDFQWLSSTNWTSETSASQQVTVSAPLCIPPDAMLRRSLPVASDGYDAHGCSVFAGVRKDGTVAVVMLEPYPERFTYSPRPVYAPSPLQQQISSTVPQSQCHRQRGERTWQYTSPPHSPVQVLKEEKEGLPFSASLPQGPLAQQKQRRPSTSIGPVARSGVKSPRALLPTRITTPPASMPDITTATTTSITGLLSGRLGPVCAVSSRCVPNTRPSPPPLSTLTPGHPRPRSVTSTVVGFPPAPRQQQPQQESNLDFDREASSPHTSVAAVPTVSVHVHSSTRALSEQAAAPAQQLHQQRPQLSQQMWSPFLPGAPPVTTLTPTVASLAALGMRRRSTNGPPPLPPPLQTTHVPPTVACTVNSNNNFTGSKGPPEPAAATLKPPPPPLSQTTTRHTIGPNSEVMAFVEAAVQARSRSTVAHSQARSSHVQPPPQQQRQHPQLHVSSSSSDTAAAIVNAPSRRLKSSALHLTPVTADVQPPLRQPPQLSVAALLLTETPATVPQFRQSNTTDNSSSRNNKSKATPNSLLPSWCLHLMDTLLTPASAAGGPVQSPLSPMQHQHQQREQRAPSAPTSTSGTATAGTTAGSDVDSKMWSVETRNGVPIGWTLKSVTAAERAAAAAAALATGTRVESPVAVAVAADATTASSNAAGRDNSDKARSHGDKSAGAVLPPPTSFSYGNLGGLNALSLPLSFSFATPDGMSERQANAHFLRAVSPPELNTGVDLNVGGGGPAHTEMVERAVAHRAKKTDGDSPPAQPARAVPRPAERKPMPGPPSAPPTQQRRYTRDSIMTHSALNVETSVNVVTPSAAVAVGKATAGPLNPTQAHAYNTTNTATTTRVGSMQQMTSVHNTSSRTATTARAVSLPAGDPFALGAGFDDTDRPPPLNLQVTATTTTMAAASAVDTTAQEHAGPSGADLSVEFTLSQFQRYHQQQQRRRRAAVRVADALPVTGATMMHIAANPPSPLVDQSADATPATSEIGRGGMAGTVFNTAYLAGDVNGVSGGWVAGHVLQPPLLASAPVYILRNSTEGAASVAAEFANAASKAWTTAATTMSTTRTTTGLVGRAGAAAASQTVFTPSRPLLVPEDHSTSSPTRHESQIESEKRRKEQGQPTALSLQLQQEHSQQQPSVPLSGTGARHAPRRPQPTQHAPSPGHQVGHLQ